MSTSVRTFQVKGPDFIALQVKNLETAKQFYKNVVGLEPALQSPPDAVVFNTKPVAFALRKPLVKLEEVNILGHGVSLWFGVQHVTALLEQLKTNNVEIVRPLSESPFGKTFTFRDPDGYLITAHEA